MVCRFVTYTQTLSNILELKAGIENKIASDFGKKGMNANLLLQYLFIKPVIHVKQVQEHLGISYKAANQLVSDFVEADILKEVTGNSRNRVFSFTEYIKLF